MSSLDYLYGILLTPLRTSKEIAFSEPVGTGIVVSFGCGAVLVLTTLAGSPGLTGQVESPFFLALPGGLFSLLIFLLAALLILFLARFLGGEGQYFSLFSGLAISSLVFYFWPLGQLLSLVTGLQIASEFFKVLLIIWYLLLTVAVIKSTQQLSLPNSVLTVLGSAAALLILIFLGSMSLVSSLVVLFG
ncbi:MAG: YIP1 family protein [Bacillota bacterium]